MYIVRDHGHTWIGVRARLVRGRIEADAIGHISIATADELGREIAQKASGHLPLLIDLRRVELGFDAAVAGALFLSSIRAVAQWAPIAIIGDAARLAALYLRTIGQRIMWFDSPDLGRRWLRRQMIA
jgi:hypothetical protein